MVLAFVRYGRCWGVARSPCHRCWLVCRLAVLSGAAHLVRQQHRHSAVLSVGLGPIVSFSLHLLQALRCIYYTVYCLSRQATCARNAFTVRTRVAARAICVDQPLEVKLSPLRCHGHVLPICRASVRGRNGHDGHRHRKRAIVFRFDDFFRLPLHRT